MRRRNFIGGVVTAVLVGACGVAASLSACSNGGNGTPDSSTCTTSNALQIHFAPMYSAFITDSTNHTFQIPAVVTGSGGAIVTGTWSASDPAAVDFVTDPTTGGTIMTLKALAPTVTITAQVGALCTSTPLNVTSALEADWEAGSARYNNGVPVYPGCVGTKVVPLLGDSGLILPPPPDSGCPDAGPACTGCHGTNATGGFFQGVQHSPEQTGGFSDQALVDIFVNAIDPTFDSNILPYEYWHAFHTWSDIATPEQQKAMVVYLRSLAPAPDQGGINFGLLKDSGILSD